MTSDDKELSVGADLKQLGIEGPVEVVDLWTGQNLGKVSDKIERELKPHASILCKISSNLDEVTN